MNPEQHPVDGLESCDAQLRNDAALKIVDKRLHEAVPALAAAIARSTNIGANGTLVYALGHFDCSRHFELLVDVALHHGFEASGEAMTILMEKDLDLTYDQLAAVARTVSDAEGASLSGFQRDALKQIRERFLSPDSGEEREQRRQT